MSLRDNLLPAVDRLRGIAHTLGFRTFTVQLVKKSYPDGDPFSGKSAVVTTTVDITNGDAPPKVRWLNQRDLYRGAPPDAELAVGPITPSYDGGGLSYETLEQMSAETGDEIYYVVNGPGFDNTRFKLTGFRGERALGFFIYLRRASDNP